MLRPTFFALAVTLVSIPANRAAQLPRAPAKEADAHDLAVIFADWAARRAGVNSLRYVLEGEKTIFEKTLRSARIGEAPPAGGWSIEHDITHPAKRTLILDLSGKRFRKDADDFRYDLTVDRIYEFFTTSIYDGAQPKVHTPRKKNTNGGFRPRHHDMDLSLLDPSLTRESMTLTIPEIPPLLAHGIVPDIQPEISVADLFVDQDYRRLGYHIHGRAIFRDQQCIVLRRPRGSGTVDELWVDPAKSSAVVKALNYQGGKLLCYVEIEYGRAANVWMPKDWKAATMLTPEIEDGVTVFRVQRYEVNPQLDAAGFDVPMSPGMFVSKVGKDRKKSYFLVQSDGSLGPLPENVDEPTWSGRSVGLTLVTAAFVVISGLLIWARRVRRQRGG